MKLAAIVGASSGSWVDASSLLLSATVGLLALWAVANAVWAAPEGSWLGDLRRRFGGEPDETLFLRGELGATPAQTYLRALDGRRAVLFADRALTVGSPVDFVGPIHFHGRVRRCQPLGEGSHWFRIAVALDVKRPGSPAG